MQTNDFYFTGLVEIFPGQGGWHYVRVPEDIYKVTKTIATRGLTPITASVGKTTFKTSMLPYGDGSQFIALSKKVRSAENISLGDVIKVSFVLRDY